MQPSELDGDRGWAADLRDCAKSIRYGSRTFYAASMLLPARIRNAAFAVYAFCRLSDDAVDLSAQKRDAHARLERRLSRIYAGRPFDAAADRAFCKVVEDYAIPYALPAALLEGLAWDAEFRRYRSLSDLEDYAARVAGAVGAIMALLMGARSEHAAARATDLGVAMQFTNIARDVGEDARAGRLYLPLSWFEEAGVDPADWLAQGGEKEALAAMTGRLLREAERLYERGEAGVAFLPSGCRSAIRAARLIYADIGRAVETRGCDYMAPRAVVPLGRKLVLARDAMMRPSTSKELAVQPPLPANAFLVEAVRKAQFAPMAHEARLDDRLAGVIELMSKLERRDRLMGAGAR